MDLRELNIIITGGCGFIGHHFVEHLYKNTNWNIYIIDKLSYASNGFERIRQQILPNGEKLINQKRIKIFTTDLSHKRSPGLIYELGDINIIFHLAADTHVDHSIEEPVNVIKNNIMSTVHLLEYARTLKNIRTVSLFWNRRSLWLNN